MLLLDCQFLRWLLDVGVLLRLPFVGVVLPPPAFVSAAVVVVVDVCPPVPSFGEVHLCLDGVPDVRVGVP